ncbi:hypothetical protein OUZ56_006248 [Daphnia magna]|uniref:Uncharacterized protein n=1 Tax=Daphnia magna TaxID=35525 RepID=A0ABQ9YV34_9CRUS|nr:hypothetical protein OUZ56_006248 [Daphnia magna]
MGCLIHNGVYMSREIFSRYGERKTKSFSYSTWPSIGSMTADVAFQPIPSIYYPVSQRVSHDAWKSAAVAHRVSCVRQTPVQWSSPHPQRFKDNMSIMRARSTMYPNTQQPPNALDERTASTTTLTSIDDATVSFLFKVKLFPFRLKTALDESSARGSSSSATAPETGIVAFGIDIGFPGSLGGVGYGHQRPIESLSISSVRIHAKSLSNSIDDRLKAY